MTERGFRFGKERRLHASAEFAEILRHGRRFAGAYFLVWALPNRLGLARLGLIVGRKAAARAVARNSLKRLVRESFRLQQAELGAVDLVVQARSRPGSGRSALRDDLLGLFMAVKAWRG